MEEKSDHKPDGKRNLQAMEYSVKLIKKIMEEEALLEQFDEHIETIVDRKLDDFENKLKNNWKGDKDSL